MAVLASTVYAVVLRAQPAVGVEGEQQSVIVSQAPLPPRSTGEVAPTVWGRLMMMDRDVDRPTIVHHRRVIRTPPLKIDLSRNAGPARRVRPTPALHTGGGVMARFRAPQPRTDLPQEPDRSQIARVMSSIRRRVQQCYDTGMVPGQVDLVLKVEGDSGEVSHANVSADSSTATCIQQLARTLRFPRFSKDHVTVRYPYSFR